MRNATPHDGTRRNPATRTRRHNVTIRQNDMIESMISFSLRNHDGKNFQAQESSGNDGVVAAPWRMEPQHDPGDTGRRAYGVPRFDVFL